MAAHPSLSASQTPNWKFLAASEQARKQHKSGAHNSESESYRASTTRAGGRVRGVNDVNGRCDAQDDERNRQPLLMSTVNAHFGFVRVLAIFYATLFWPETDSGARQRISADPRGAPRRAGKHRRNSARHTLCTDRTK